MIERIILMGASLLLIAPEAISSIVGLILGCGLLTCNYLRYKRHNKEDKVNA